MSIKLVIVGGVAGGATAAARARRLDLNAEIILFERDEHISFANCGLPYYVGGVIEQQSPLLLISPEKFKRRYRIDVRVHSEVMAVDRASRTVRVRETLTGREYSESYDRLILAPGAKPIIPPLPGIDDEAVFTLRNIPDAERIKSFVDSRHAEAAVIVGGGFIGLEMAENLSHKGLDVTIVEKMDQLMAPLDPEMAAQAKMHLDDKKITCHLGEGVRSLTRKDHRLTVATDLGRRIECDLLVLSVGVRPDSNLAREAGLNLNQQGLITVNAAMQTSDPDIFAVGDAVEVRNLVSGHATWVALAGPANRQARIAADNTMGRRSLFRGTISTAVVKLFDLTVGSCGFNQKTCRRLNIPHLVSHILWDSHATYYPNATSMVVKLVFSPSDGRILGAQIVGRDGVDKRLDILATAIQAGMTTFDLENLELAYAPPFSTAKDVVNIAGYVASNILKGDMEIATWEDLASLDPNRDVLIDLREQHEIEALGTIPGSLHIPIDDLWDRLPQLDRTKSYIVYCAWGQRAFWGYRIMSQNGFSVRNLSGGYATYSPARDLINMLREKKTSEGGV